MPRLALDRVTRLLQALESLPAEMQGGVLWLAVQALEHPALAPYIADPLTPLEGEYLSLDCQYRALQTELHAQQNQESAVGACWGALYWPALKKAQTCRVAVALVDSSAGYGWPSPEPVVPVSPSVSQSALQALQEALALMEQVGMPPPRPALLLYGVEGGASAVGDSLGLPLFLATLSALTHVPLSATLGATGALKKGRLCTVDWTEQKRVALHAQGLTLLSPPAVKSLAEAAVLALDAEEHFRVPLQKNIPPLVPHPTFLAVDTELTDFLTERERLLAFEGTVIAALERLGGFLYRRQATADEGIRAAFATPEAACEAARAVQEALVRRVWPSPGEPLQARIGLFQGSAERVQEGYVGPAPGQAVRIMQAAHPGQILLPKELADKAGVAAVSLGAHRLRDLAMVLELCRLDVPGTPCCALAPRTLRVRNHNLPVEPNPLLGRTKELAAIRDLLESGKRLVTLTGAGGIGKTRLVLQVAAELADRFADGVWFVRLAEVQNEAQLDAAIAEALGLDIRDSRVHFMEALTERKMLLVLDNFETALRAAPHVAHLLRQAPGLVCLVTSQALLSLTGEWRFEVDPLPRDEAKQLFLERALQVNPTLSPSESEILCIERICQRLEGVPLAVELAAARCRLFALKEIEARLDNALGLLVTRARDVPERQRTLRGALEWSFSLLDTQERQHFLRLSLLPGAFRTEAGRLVCEEPELEEWLAALEEKSLLRRAPEGRWRMLSIVRQFAQEQLALCEPECRSAEQGLLNYCRSLARQAASYLDTPEEIAIFKLLEADFEMIRLSIELMQKQPVTQLAEYLIDLDFFLRRRRYIKELGQWCDIVLEKTDELDRSTYGRVLSAKSYCFREDSDEINSLMMIDKILEICSEDYDPILYADSISSKAIILTRKGEFEKALEIHEKAGGIYEKEKNQIRIVRNLNNKAQIKIRQQNFADAEIDLNRASEIGTKISCTRDKVVTMNSLGFLYSSIGRFNDWKDIVFICMGENADLGYRDPFIYEAINFYRFKYVNGECNVLPIFVLSEICNGYDFSGYKKDLNNLIDSFNLSDVNFLRGYAEEIVRNSDFSNLINLKNKLEDISNI